MWAKNRLVREGGDRRVWLDDRYEVPGRAPGANLLNYTPGRTGGCPEGRTVYVGETGRQMRGGR